MSLYPLLQQFLVENDNLPVVSKGQFTIEHSPAKFSNNDKNLTPPVYQISYVTTEPSETDLQKLVSFVAVQLGITTQQASELLENEFIHKTADNNGELDWLSIGFSKGKNGEIHSTQNDELSNYLQPVTVEKIMRQPVSEPVISQPSTIVSEVVFEEEEVVEKDYWWVWALVIFLLSAILILFQFA